MKFISRFLNTRHRLYRRTFVVSDEDWGLLSTVFTESGFKSYFPGFAVRVLCDQLRKQNITNIHARFGHSTISTVPGLLSNLEAAWATCLADEREGAGRVNETTSRECGISTNAEKEPIVEVRSDEEASEKWSGG